VCVGGCVGVGECVSGCGVCVWGVFGCVCVVVCVVCRCVGVCACVCLCVKEFFFSILFPLFAVYKCLHAVPAMSLENSAQVRFANLCLSLAAVRPLSYRFC
jgi:hypothetical protein